MVVLSRRRKVGLLLLITIITIPILYTGTVFLNNIEEEKEHIPSVITATQLYNVTYANLTYGTNTTNIWGAKELDSIDNTNASFIESLYVGVNSTLMGDTYTDSTTGWIEEYRFKNLETVTDAAIGTTSIRAQFSASSGNPILAFDNHTSYTMNLDTSHMDEFNVSIKGSAAGSTLQQITFFYNSTRYYYVTLAQAVTTSWVTVTMDRGMAVSVGGMTATDAINWIDFIYISPAANRWMYIDAPTFYNETYARRLSVSFNITGIGPFEHYALNVTAASNVSVEYMEISDHFIDDAVYDIDNSGWNTFSIVLATAPIVTNTYFVVFINDTLLSDISNSTLDVDLLQVYAWNETDTFPEIHNAICTNPDDTSVLYAGYRNYTITLNLSDADGFADIHYASIGMTSLCCGYFWKAGFFEDNKTFVEELYPDNFTLTVSECAFQTGGNYLNLTFSFEIELPHGSIFPLSITTFVNDTDGNSVTKVFGLQYRVEVNVDVYSAAFSDDRGNYGATLFATGNAYYFESSNISVDEDTYDIWVTNFYGEDNKSTAVIGVGGAFNVTNITTPAAVGLYTYYVGAKEKGNATSDCYCHDYHTMSYIGDALYVTFTRNVLLPINMEEIIITPHIEYEYDGLSCTNYDIVLSKDGVVWKGADESNYTTVLLDSAVADTHIYEVDSVTDNTYGITTHDYLPMAVSWFSGTVEVDDDWDDDDDDDDWGDDFWVFLEDALDVPDDPFFFFIVTIIIIGIFMGCIGCSCTSESAMLERTRILQGSRSVWDYKTIPFLPAVLKRDNKNKKKRKRKK